MTVSCGWWFGPRVSHRMLIRLVAAGEVDARDDLLEFEGGALEVGAWGWGSVGGGVVGSQVGRLAGGEEAEGGEEGGSHEDSRWGRVRFPGLPYPCAPIPGRQDEVAPNSPSSPAYE